MTAQSPGRRENGSHRSATGGISGRPAQAASPGPDEPTSGEARLADDDARARIGGATADLTENVFVEAGAGTGKTSALVDRLVATAAEAGADGLHRIAAITFTEAAAAELRTRVGEGLRASADPAVQALSARADEITVGTIHGFARALLAEHAIAAGLPPGFDVLDEATAVVELRASWSRFLRQLLDDPEARPALVRGRALGLRVQDLEVVALSLHRHWDHLSHPAAAVPLAEWRRGPGAWPEVRVAPLAEALEPLVGLAAECTDPDDALCTHLREVVAPAVAELLAASGEPVGEPGNLARLRRLAALPKLSHRGGRKPSWPGAPVAEVRDRLREAEEVRTALLAGERTLVIRDLTARVAAFVLHAAEERQRSGRLGFHDLLVLAHRLASRDPGALAAMRDHYRWLFVDELQDTDPLQTELAFLLAGEPPRPGGLFVVGDPKQSIYRFRRADIQQYARIQERLDTRLELQCNFRSVPAIVHWVNAVFAELLGADPPAGQAPHRDLLGTRPARHQVPVPVVVVGGPSEDPAPVRRAAAAADVARVVGAAHGDGREHGWLVHDRTAPDDTWRPARWSDVAVLFPARTALADLELALEGADIPYRLEGAALAWQSQEVRDLLAVLRAAEEPAGTVAVLSALRSPLFGCGDDDLLAYARAHPNAWDPLEAAGAGDPSQVARGLAALARYHRLRWTEEPSALLGRIVRERRAFELALAHRRPRDRWQRIRWLLEQARQFDEQHGGPLADLLTWADAQAAEDGRSGAAGTPDPDDDAVRVMTVHGAKGLEFPIVVLTGLDSRPSATKEAALWDRDGTLQVSVGSASEDRLFCTDGYAACREEDQRLDELERRRLLYVAATRARDHLVLALHRKEQEPSLAALIAGALDSRGHLWRPFDDGDRATAEDDQAEEPDGPAAAEPASPAPAVASGEHNTHASREGGPAGDRSPDVAPVTEPAASAGQSRSGAGPGGRPPPSWEAECAAWRAELTEALVRTRRRPVVTAMLLVEAAAAGGSDHPAPDPAEPGIQDSPRWDADAGLRRGRAVHDALRELDLERRVSRAGARAASDVARQYARAHGLRSTEEQDEVARLVTSALIGPLAGLVAGRRTYQEMPVAVPLPGLPETPDGAPPTRPLTAPVRPGPGGSAWGPQLGQPVLEGTVDLVVEMEDGYAVVDYKTSAETDREDAIARYRAQLAAYALAVEATTGRSVTGAFLYLLGPGEARLEPLVDLRDAISELPELAARALRLP